MQLEVLNNEIISCFDEFIKEKIYYEKIDSTQLECWRLANDGKIQSGTMIIADIQTAGIGTHGRVWHTSEKGNIALSMYFKTNNLKISAIKDLPVKIAYFIAEKISLIYKVNLDIKYPNDLMWHDKKVGGILVETKIQAEKVKEIVIGIGINVTQEVFPIEISKLATSINNILIEDGGDK